MTKHRIQFRMNHRKALEVILWCASKRGSVDFHTVVKVLFAAEIDHLNKYGRPIVGDTFKAMPYGPVALQTYDLMQRMPMALEGLGNADPPFDLSGYMVTARRKPDLSIFSESEVEALEAGFSEYGYLPFSRRTERSHQHPAWIKAWDAGGLNMDYADFLNEQNATPEVMADLAEVGMALKL